MGMPFPPRGASMRSRQAAPARKGLIRVAVIGAGFGATVHIPALRTIDNVEIAAIVSRRLERAQEIASQFRIPIATNDWRDVVRDPHIDAVIVATPPFLHHQMVIAALEARKHIICEKPMARNLAEARDMVKLAGAANIIAMVNHEFRYIPIRQRVKELIDEGYIGDPHSVAMNVFRSTLADPTDRPFSWLMEADKAGGMLGAAGSHAIDTLRWWLGEVHEVAGTVGTMVKRRRLSDSSGMVGVDADDNFAILLRFASDAIGSIHFSATAPIDAGEEITISGSEGMLIAQGDSSLLGARRRDPGLRELPIPERLLTSLPESAHPLLQPTALLLRDWFSTIRTGEWSAAAPSFADGAKTQEILDGVLRSRTQGRWIDTSGTRWQIGVSRSALPNPSL